MVGNGAIPVGCYTGPGAKKKAIKQGIAIEGPKKFKKMANEADKEFRDIVATDTDIIMMLHIKE